MLNRTQSDNLFVPMKMLCPKVPEYKNLYKSTVTGMEGWVRMSFYGMTTTSRNDGENYFHHRNSVKSPSAKVIMQEANNYSAAADKNEGSWVIGSNTVSTNVTFVHNFRANFLFWDGHIKANALNIATGYMTSQNYWNSYQ